MHERNKHLRMDRRRFLKVVGLTTGGMTLAPFLSGASPLDRSRVIRSNRRYRGTQDGKILASTDGATWFLLADFGKHLCVRQVKVIHDTWLRVRLEIGGSTFELWSRDEKTWYTRDYVTPEKA